jgi:hypothetical protein
MTLQTLLEAVIKMGLLKASRIGPMRTAVKQYAAMLEVDPAACLPNAYHLPEAQLRRLIDTRAPHTLGPHGLRNLKNNLRFLLQMGITHRLIPPLPTSLQSWRGTRLLTVSHIPRHEGSYQPRYGLYPLPSPLAEEVAEYLAWCASPYAPDRPSSIKKRPVSLRNSRLAFAQMVGFAVHRQGLSPAELTLGQLLDPAVVDGFVTWWVARRGKVTPGIHKILHHLIVVARHWLKNDALAAQLTQRTRALPPPERVRDKRQRWLSLRELEAIGCSRYPLNATRLREYRHARRISEHLRDSEQHPDLGRLNLRGVALYVEVSLILRLLVRIPLRQRNIREMQRDRNLRRLPDDTWEISFRGQELKIAQRRGREHHVVYTFPPDLQGLLDEWLHCWRPRLAQPTEQLVFVNRSGKPFSDSSLGTLLSRVLYP